MDYRIEERDGFDVVVKAKRIETDGDACSPDYVSEIWLPVKRT